MRARVKATPRTWLLVLLAILLSGVIAWLETRAPTPRPAAAAEPADGYTVDVELAPAE